MSRLRVAEVFAALSLTTDLASGVLARRFAAIAGTEGPRAARTGCEVSRALGGRLGLPAAAVDALDEVDERWDGLGIPDGRRGEQLSLIGRVVHVAEQAVFAHADGGVAGARAEVARRAGGHLDPDLAAAFLRDADALLSGLDAPDLLAAIVAAEPGPAPRSTRTVSTGCTRRSPSSSI